MEKRTGHQCHLKNLSSTETVEFRRELTEEKSMSVLLYDNFQFLFN